MTIEAYVPLLTKVVAPFPIAVLLWTCPWGKIQPLSSSTVGCTFRLLRIAGKDIIRPPVHKCVHSTLMMRVVSSSLFTLATRTHRYAALFCINDRKKAFSPPQHLSCKYITYLTAKTWLLADRFDRYLSIMSICLCVCYGAISSVSKHLLKFSRRTCPSTKVPVVRHGGGRIYQRHFLCPWSPPAIDPSVLLIVIFVVFFFFPRWKNWTHGFFIFPTIAWQLFSCRSTWTVLWFWIIRFAIWNGRVATISDSTPSESETILCRGRIVSLYIWCR